MSINRKGVKSYGMGMECNDWDIVRVYNFVFTRQN